MTWKDEKSLGLTPPLRPEKNGHGTKGRPIQLDTNHFEVTFTNPDLVMCQYDVTISDYRGQSDSQISKAKKKIVFEKLKEIHNKDFAEPLAYDREKSAYGVGVISVLKKKKPKEYKVTLISEDGNNRAAPGDKINGRSQYTVTLKLTSKAGLKDLLDSFKQGGCTKENSSPIQMVEVMFRHYRANKYMEETISRSKYFSFNEEFGRSFEIGGDKKVYAGFNASLRPTEWKKEFALIVNNSHTVLYKKQSVMEFLSANIRNINFNQPFDEATRLSAERHLKGLKIRVTHAPIKRTYPVRGVSSNGADTMTFPIDGDGAAKETSISQYFRDRYKKELLYPKASCLHVGKPDGNIHMPIEVCEIQEGQKVKTKLSDRETADMIKETAMKPASKRESIRNIVSRNKFPEDEMLNALGCSIDSEPLRISGRVLPSPKLIMKTLSFQTGSFQTGPFQPRDGVWDLRNKKFHKASTLKHWAVINYNNRVEEEELRTFVEKLMNIGRELGMSIEDPFSLWDATSKPHVPYNDLLAFKKENPEVQLVLCILPDRRLYSAIKKAGDFDLGILTSGVQGINVQKCHPVTISNILLKINPKLGGINNVFDIEDLPMFKEPTLVLGADVNHPAAGPPGDNPVPSFAAVVGSFDLNATQYAAEVRAQERRSEVIVDMKEIVRNLLCTFRSKTGKIPTKIIMYRDGVSESQFETVLVEEMMKIREACSSLKETYKPCITFICVQKRHNTRLFPVDSRDADRKSGNVPPGTVVDRYLTHPTQSDFFLCSHQGIQGTSRPAHYHVLWDDSDHSMDDLQAFTYKLCHVYSRCTRSVSIPTPTYYAHLAASRAKDIAKESQCKTLEEYQECSRVASGMTLCNVQYYI